MPRTVAPEVATSRTKWRTANRSGPRADSPKHSYLLNNNAAKWPHMAMEETPMPRPAIEGDAPAKTGANVRTTVETPPACRFMAKFAWPLPLKAELPPDTAPASVHRRFAEPRKRIRAALEKLPGVQSVAVTERVRAVKEKYALTMDGRERQALEAVLAGCTAEQRQSWHCPAMQTEAPPDKQAASPDVQRSRALKVFTALGCGTSGSPCGTQPLPLLK